MDVKRIIIFVILLVALVFAGKRACYYWRLYHPTPTAVPAPTQPAPAQPAPAQPAPAQPAQNP